MALLYEGHNVFIVGVGWRCDAGRTVDCDSHLYSSADMAKYPPDFTKRKTTVYGLVPVLACDITILKPLVVVSDIEFSVAAIAVVAAAFPQSTPRVELVTLEVVG